METTLHSKVHVSGMYKVAAYTALGLIGFFMLMKLLNLITIVELRFINVVIILYGVRHVLIQYRDDHQNNLEYLQGMMTGFMTAFLSAVIFSAFIFVYLNLDSGFMNYLRQTQAFGSYLTPASSALVTLIEGAASGAIVTFMLMHTMNRDNVQG